MGCDGGTIPRRDELVKVKKRPEQKDRVSELSFLWQHCNISQEPLRKPIVACGLGRLYNKDVIIEKLLDKSLPESVSHVKRLRDVKDLTLTGNPAYKAEAEKGGNTIDRQTAPYICPVSGLEMNGKFKFCFYWTCGCVLSERAIKQFSEKHCLSCQKPFTDDDIVVLNASDDDLALMVARQEQRSKVKSSKKVKVKTEPAEEVQNDEKPTTSICTKDVKVKVEINDDVKIKVEKPGKSETCTTKVSGSKRSATEIYDPAYKKTKQTYSVSKDPNATEVYKSLFTTHKDAKTHMKAHWVTYNPFYN